MSGCPLKTNVKMNNNIVHSFGDNFNDYKGVFQFDLETKTGFIKLLAVAIMSDMSEFELIDELKSTNSKLHKWVIKFVNCSSSELIDVIKYGYLTGKMMQAILQYRSIVSDVAFEYNAKWSGLAADMTIANIVGYQTYTQLQPEKRAEVLIGNSKDFLYQRAFYKTKLNTAWNYFYGRDLINMIEDPDTGEKTMLPGDGYPLYKIFVEGLGETFKQYYDKVNPRVENQRFRQYTYSQVMYKHTLLTRALNSYVDKLQIIMLEISLNEGLNHPNLTEEILNKRRIAARKTLYKRIDGMSTIANLVEFFDKQDEERSNQNFFLAS